MSLAQAVWDVGARPPVPDRGGRKGVLTVAAGSTYIPAPLEHTFGPRP